MFKRLLALVLVVGLGFGAWSIGKFPTWNIGLVAGAQNVDVQPRKAALICPGPVFTNGGASGVTLGAFTQSGNVNIDSLGGNSTSSTDLIITDDGSSNTNLNAIQTQLAAGTQVSGLLATNCSPGVGDAWLVAGDNSIGREALLVLANPGKVDATVSLQLLGGSGAIQGAGLSGISAPAGKVTVLPLSSFAPKASTFAVQVSVRGSELGVWLQQKTVRGLTPGGVDLVGPAANPALIQDIPGVFLRQEAKLETQSLQPDFSDLTPILRIVNPGAKTATFTAQVQAADGASFGTVVQGEVAAGSVKDFPLTNLADGNYAVHIESDQVTSAAVRYSRFSGSNQDFAWAAAVTAQKLSSSFVTPTGSKSRLSVTNSNKTSVTLTLNGKSYQIQPLSDSQFQLNAGAHNQISSSQPVSASQVIDVNGSIAVVPVSEFQSVGGKLKVRIR